MQDDPSCQLVWGLVDQVGDLTLISPELGYLPQTNQSQLMQTGIYTNGKVMAGKEMPSHTQKRVSSEHNQLQFAFLFSEHWSARATESIYSVTATSKQNCRMHRNSQVRCHHLTSTEQRCSPQSTAAALPLGGTHFSPLQRGGGRSSPWEFLGYVALSAGANPHCLCTGAMCVRQECFWPLLSPNA